jgi:hypothetical protein
MSNVAHRALCTICGQADVAFSARGIPHPSHVGGARHQAALQPPTAQPELRTTPYGVYCWARTWTALGREFPIEACNGDPQLLFCALMGVEDGVRFRVNPRFPVPLERALVAAMLEAVATRHAPAPPRAEPPASLELLDEIADQTAAQRRTETPLVPSG